MLKKVLIASGMVVVVLLGVIAMQPAQYTVVRSATIGAPPATVFGLINDFHKWDSWSPWGKLDPNMKTTYEGAASGPGGLRAES